VAVSRARSFFIRFGAPLVLIVGIGAIVLGRRAIQLKHSLQEWGDSLSKGSGPVAMGIPFVPAYLDGMKIGSLDSVQLQRHEPHTVDSLRLVVALSDAPAASQARRCAVELVSFDPGDFKHALACVADTAGLVPFGRVSFTDGGGVPLYVPRDELACAPWTDRSDATCVRHRVQIQVRRDMEKMRRQMRDQMRNIPKPPVPPTP
jgi:hypothetical protein